MRVRVKVLSEKTNHDLITAEIDTPPFGLTRKDVWDFVSIMRKTRSQLEKTIGHPVRLAIDSWESSVFWYLVLHRPLKFDEKHPIYGGQEQTVYGLIKTKEGAEDLKKTNLGVIADLDNMLLVLYWPEAKNGICKDLQSCPSWQNVIDDFKKRTGRDPGDDFMEKSARAFSFTLPGWHLSKLGYPRKIFFKRNARLKDFIALDLNGIDIPQLAVRSAIELPAVRLVRFVHFYVDNEEEYRLFVAHHSKLQKKYGKQRRRLVQEARDKDLRKKENEQKKKLLRTETAILFQITREILALANLLGFSYRGRPVKFLSSNKSDALFKRTVEAFVNGDVLNIKWDKVNRHAEEIERLLELNDPHVPESFRKWTWWKDHASKIHSELQKIKEL